MRPTTTRLAFAFVVFVFVAQWSRPAMADVTIKGTVGEMGVSGTYCSPGFYVCNSNTNALVRFKMTDLSQTNACTGGANATGLAGYAWMNVAAPGGKEVYAMLLVSKKGAPIVCTINDAATCQITSCTLP